MREIWLYLPLVLAASCHAGSASPLPDHTPANVDLDASTANVNEGIDAAVDPTDAGHDVTHTTGCDDGFLVGLNYPWLHFAGDFGGIRAWSQRGVDGERARHEERFKEMAQLGARVVRWWIFPDLRGDGIRVDASGAIVGLGDTVERDIAAAIDLAELHGIQLVFCLFSFDALRASRAESGVKIQSLRAHLVDPQRRAQLMALVVRPLVRAASRHPHAARILEWEIINEPEWAVRGPAPAGVATFTPSPEIETITHAEMRRFLTDAAQAIRAETAVPTSIGVARAKWLDAWRGAGIDRLQGPRLRPSKRERQAWCHGIRQRRAARGSTHLGRRSAAGGGVRAIVRDGG